MARDSRSRAGSRCDPKRRAILGPAPSKRIRNHPLPVRRERAGVRAAFENRAESQRSPHPPLSHRNGRGFRNCPLMPGRFAKRFQIHVNGSRGFGCRAGPPAFRAIFTPAAAENRVWGRLYNEGTAIRRDERSSPNATRRRNDALRLRLQAPCRIGSRADV